MYQFVCFEAAEDNDYVSLENESCEGETMSDTDVDFIDDTEYNESVENFYAFENVSREYDVAIGDFFVGFDFSQEPSDYCSDNEICNEVIEFKDSKKKVKEFDKTLINPQGDENVDSLFYAILYAIRYTLTEKSDPCESDNELQNDIKLDGISEIFLLKENMTLDLDILTFENQCHQINCILNKNNLFLRIFELKEKFRSFIKQDPEKKMLLENCQVVLQKSITTFTLFD